MAMGKKHYLAVAALVASLILSAGILAYAGFGHRTDMSGFFLYKLDQTTEELSLSPEQEASYQYARAELERMFADLATVKEEVHTIIHTQLESGDPDIDTVSAAAKTMVAAMGETMPQAIDVLATLYTMLTPEQQEMVLREIKERHGPMCR